MGKNANWLGGKSTHVCTHPRRLARQLRAAVRIANTLGAAPSLTQRIWAADLLARYATDLGRGDYSFRIPEPYNTRGAGARA